MSQPRSPLINAQMDRPSSFVSQISLKRSAAGFPVLTPSNLAHGGDVLDVLSETPESRRTGCQVDSNRLRIDCSR
jgi:hypothetical protein